MLRRLFGGDDDSAPPVDPPPGVAIDLALQRLEIHPYGFAIFEPPDGRYVQVTRDGTGGLLGEAVGNGYLDDGSRLGDDELKTLATLGWTVLADGAGNHTRTWQDWMGDRRAGAVDDILATLVLAFEMPAEGPLMIQEG